MIALTREVPSSIAECQLTHVAREPIDVARARVQHMEYEDALRACGCEVVRLPELHAHPDSVFVEDVALVFDEGAVMTRPGAVSRQGEVAPMAASLGHYRRTVRALSAPGTLDGGDVLRLGRTIWVGRSARSNAEGIAQLGNLVADWGYTVRAAAMRDALHLKSAVTAVADDVLVVNPAWVDASQFAGYTIIEVDESEPFAANAVLVNGRVIHSTAFPKTQARLRAAGIDVVAVDASELAKAEGGVTCCSLLLG
jgi:dimethylargininase